MDMHAYKHRDRQIVTVNEPVSHDVRFTLVDRDGETFAELESIDLDALYDKLPHGASRVERGEIESYLCSVAEQS
jgi:hypothetical protein